MDNGTSLPVLDHGYVKLIAWMGTDETIVEAARMSTGKGFISWDPYPDSKRGDAGLLEYLYKNQHMTPFEMCELAIEVQAPIFVVREWHRHRTQSYNEFSGRYAEMENLYYVPSVDRIQKQHSINKQGSGEPFDAKTKDEIRNTFFSSGAWEARSDYESLLHRGVARELARINLPLSQYTRFRAKANLRNWLGFLLLRTSPQAQYEIREFATAVAYIVRTLWPRTYALYEKYDQGVVKLTRDEIGLLAKALNVALSTSLGEFEKGEIARLESMLRKLNFK